MAYKDLHDEPFDEGTITKLEIFQDYAQAWIPTFVMSGFPTICIFDFFAGTGYDKNGIEGSPIRILQKIKDQIGHIYQKKVKIKVYFNEFQPNNKEQTKFETLQQACEDFLNENKSVRTAIEIYYYNEDFKTLFQKLSEQIRKHPSLVYLDQNGVQFISDRYFLELEKTKQTDFLYFISSSYLWRFGGREEFQAHLPINMSEAKKNPYKYIHKFILDYLRTKIPSNSNLKLYPFTIKKGANIYGIIFGASHPRAVDKFLGIAWKKNETNGAANFDIDDDLQKNQIDLFSGRILTKVEQFKQLIRDKILKSELKNNRDTFNFTLEQGHIGSHSAECLKELKNKQLLHFEGNLPLLTYDNVYKNKKIIDYKILK